MVAAEEIRLLKEENVKEAEKIIESLATPYGFRAAVQSKLDFAKFKSGVENFVNMPRN